MAASAPGTAPYFGLAWMLKKNGLSVKDVKVVTLEPQAAASAFVAGAGELDVIGLVSDLAFKRLNRGLFAWASL